MQIHIIYPTQWQHKIPEQMEAKDDKRPWEHNT